VYKGQNWGRGALGVGGGTTIAVVSSSYLFQASKYMLTELFF